MLRKKVVVKVAAANMKILLHHSSKGTEENTMNIFSSVIEIRTGSLQNRSYKIIWWIPDSCVSVIILKIRANIVHVASSPCSEATRCSDSHRRLVLSTRPECDRIAEGFFGGRVLDHRLTWRPGTKFSLSSRQTLGRGVTEDRRMVSQTLGRILHNAAPVRNQMHPAAVSEKHR